MRKRRLIVAAMVLALTGCSTDAPPSAERADSIVPTLAPTTTTSPPELEPAAPDASLPEPPLPEPAPGGPIIDGRANGLILVLDRDAGAESLVVVAVDGSTVTTLSRSADELLVQPVWSPDGRRIAWARTTDGVDWELAHAAVDGSDEQSVALPGRPDYLSFDPTAARILALTPSPAGFGLVVVDLVDEPTLRVADVGQPFFTDAAPDGTRAVAHVGDDVRLVDLAGVGSEPGSFGDRSTTHQTPQWHPTEELVVYTVDAGESSGDVVVRDVAAGTVSSVTGFEGFVLFDLDPSGERLAMSTIGAPTGGEPPRALRRQAGVAGLSIVDLTTGRSAALSDQPTAAPAWDPTGSYVLARDSIGDAGRWSVYDVADAGPPMTTDTFTIGGTEMPVYLRFWDQYVRSHTVWAPDGSAFVHVGASADGRSGVWVHDPESSGPSAFLRTGDVAFWSPT